jgi:predicted Rossmann fold flavoprotein
MARKYPRGGNFVKKTFHQFFTTDTIQWFDRRGVKLKAEKDGRMFPVSDSSQSIIDCLLKAASSGGVEILLNREVISMQYEHSLFNLQCSNGITLTADYVCIACGGYAKTVMFNWVKNAGHSIEEPVSSLFTFNMPGHPLRALMGVSNEKVKLKIAGTKLEQEGPVLITHWGLSGPAVLRLSAWGARELKEKNWEFGVVINWIPAYNEQSIRMQLQQLRTTTSSQRIVAKNDFGLPNRLWEFLAIQAGVTSEMRWADMPAWVQGKFSKNLCNYECSVKGKTTFKEEFVTAGGIKLSEIDPNTMMSKKVPGLFFAGEVMDVDGITGGFNFQHAWTSGWVAAKAITDRATDYE